MHDPCYLVKILPLTKSTYSITAPKPFTVLITMVRLEVIDNGDTHTFLFQQTFPVLSYLIALAIGILASKTLSPISKLWSELEEIDKSVYEFKQTPELLKIVECVCGPYVWKMYDTCYAIFISFWCYGKAVFDFYHFHTTWLKIGVL